MLEADQCDHSMWLKQIKMTHATIILRTNVHKATTVIVLHTNSYLSLEKFCNIHISKEGHNDVEDRCLVCDIMKLYAHAPTRKKIL